MDQNDKTPIDEIYTDALKDSGWTLEDKDCALHKTFTFKSFNEAFAFMTRVAMKAEKMNHHPEWSNIYNHVSVRLITHDTNGLTFLDHDLAVFMDKVS